MDPNALLDTILADARSMIEAYEDPDSDGIDQDDAADLAQQILSLDAWMRSGGFPPKPWDRS